MRGRTVEGRIRSVGQGHMQAGYPEVVSSEIAKIRVPTASSSVEGNTVVCANASASGPAESKTPRMHRNFTRENREAPKENMEEPNSYRTQSREIEPSGLDRVRQTARQDKEVRFTALLHHVNIDLLRSSYYSLKRRAADGSEEI